MATTINYMNAITSEHRNKPKYMAMVEFELQPMQDIIKCSNDVIYTLDLERAEGKNLDVVGEYVGVSRILPFQPENSSSKLSDDDYRFLIKSKISQNNWDGTTRGLEDIWANMFPDANLIIYDNQDMTCTMLLISSLSPLQIEMLMNGLLLPKPTGVTYAYTFVTKTLFAYDLDNSQFAGYGTGYWEGKFKLFSMDMDGDTFGGLDDSDWT